MGQLSSTQQKLVEIGRALVLEASVVVLDEPTAALPASEVDHLQDVLQRLTERNVAVIYISHRLEEIFRFADRVTVLREGRRVATRPAGELSGDEIEALLQERQEARASRDFAAADAIRDKLAAAGITIEDGPQGTTWRRSE